MLLLVAAVPLETALLRRSLGLSARPRQNGALDLFFGELAGAPIALLHTGVGKSNAAASLALACSGLPPLRAVLNLGCAGAYPRSGLSVGDLCLASAEIFGDEGVRTPEGFLDMEALGFALALRDSQPRFNHFELDASLRRQALPRLLEFAATQNRRLLQGASVTVSCCSGSDAQAMEIAGRTGGLCENMEGAALAQICFRLELPMLELRGISNLAENRDLSRWNLELAVTTAQEACLHLLRTWHPEERP